MTSRIMVEPDGTIRLPAALLDGMGLKEGDELTIEVIDGRILIQSRSDVVHRSPD